MCDEYYDYILEEQLKLSKHELTMDEVKEFVELFEKLGYEFSHFEGGVMVFRRGDEK